MKIFPKLLGIVLMLLISTSLVSAYVPDSEVSGIMLVIGAIVFAIFNGTLCI